MTRQQFTIALAAAAFSAFAAIGACAQSASPAGLWKTIDDESGKPQSLVRITESNGEFRGKVEKLFREPGEGPNPLCDKCQDERKNQPIIGMTILTGMKSERGEYDGGRILDPSNGKIYRSRMSLGKDGQTLDVRGYIGVPLLGRTQTWLREE